MRHPETIGRYEIERVIGHGAAGVVYLARDPLIDRRVAVKTLRDDLDEQFTAEYRQRFLREARAVGRLSHPTIVTIYDVGEDHEHESAFIAMEYLEGTTLKEVLARGTRYDARRAAHLVATLAEALDHAHQMGVIHRDVKPANIILTADGRVKITDFGIARLDTSDLTVEGTFIGTPNYMSPERVRGKAADTRSDLYSLGVILFELVTGRRPFTGKSLPELTLNIATLPVPDPRSLCPELNQQLTSIIMRCLAKKPADRFQSGSELARSLRGIEPATNRGEAVGAEGESLSEMSADGEPELAPPPPILPDLVPTRMHDVETLADPGHIRLMLHRWSVAAAPILRARWLWPAAISSAILLVIVLSVLFGHPDDVPPGPVAADLSTGSLDGGASSDPAAVIGSAVDDESDGGSDSAPDSGADAEREPGSGAGGHAPEPTVAPPLPESTLVVLHKNRMSLAYISLWIDGHKAWTQEMTAEKNVLKRFKRISGVQIQKSIALSDGRHLIEVHISGKSMKVEARDSITGSFREGESRFLKVSLNPYTDKLKLEWTG